MTVEVTHNTKEDGVELLFNEELELKQADFLRNTIGFNQHRQNSLKWYANNYPSYKRYADDLKIALSKGELLESVPLTPSFEASLENISKNKFSYVTISFFKDDGEKGYENYVIFDSYKKAATFIANKYVQKNMVPH